MKILCKSKTLSSEHVQILGDYAEQKNHFHITVGKEYIVLALTFDEHTCFVQIVSDYEHLIHVPIILFDVTDERISSYWIYRKLDDNCFALWPSSFFKEFYNDDLFEEVDEIVKDFSIVRAQIESEY